VAAPAKIAQRNNQKESKIPPQGDASVASSKRESRFEQAVRLASNESAYEERVFGKVVEADPGDLEALCITDRPDSVYLKTQRNGRTVALAGYMLKDGSFYVHSFWALENEVEGVVKLMLEFRRVARRMRYKSIDLQFTQERRHIIAILMGMMGLRVSVFFCEVPTKGDLEAAKEPAPRVLMRKRVASFYVESQLSLI
jgi:hypothetical protein